MFLFKVKSDKKTCNPSSCSVSRSVGLHTKQMTNSNTDHFRFCHYNQELKTKKIFFHNLHFFDLELKTKAMTKATIKRKNI